MTAGAAATGAGRVLGVARFTLAVNLRKGLTRGGVVLGSILILAGPAIGVAHDLAWHFDPQFGFFGFLVFALFGLRSGLQEQRELGMSVYLRYNVLGRAEHALAMVISLVGSWVAICAVAFVVILGVSGGDIGVAAWHTAAWGLRTLVILGFVPLVESAASFRLPLLVPALAYLVLVVSMTILLPEAEAVAYFIPVEEGDAAALRRLGLQAVGVFAAASSLFVAITVTGPPARRTLRRFLPTRR